MMLGLRLCSILLCLVGVVYGDKPLWLDKKANVQLRKVVLTTVVVTRDFVGDDRSIVAGILDEIRGKGYVVVDETEGDHVVGLPYPRPRDKEALAGTAGILFIELGDAKNAFYTFGFRASVDILQSRPGTKSRSLFSQQAGCSFNDYDEGKQRCLNSVVQELFKFLPYVQAPK